jgi:nucleoside-diphosphate-sugar epimerase
MLTLPIEWRDLHANAFEGTAVLVTGGAGFIGSHLTDALAQLGARVTVLDDLSGGCRKNLDAAPGVRFVQASILDREAVDGCMAGTHYVFHQAALGSVPRSVKEPRLYFEVNAAGTLNILESARTNGIRRIVFAASSSAYGDAAVLPKCEAMAAAPRSPYAASKVACEALIRAYACSYGLDTANLRYFNIFGPRQNSNSAYAAVIAAFAKALAAHEPPRIFGDGTQSRDFTFVANAVHANLLAARAEGELKGEVFNVATGRQVTVNELARQMAQLLGSNTSPAYLEQRAGDVMHSLGDLTKSSDRIGYAPIVGFEEGLAMTVQWYQQQLEVASLSALTHQQSNVAAQGMLAK